MATPAADPSGAPTPYTIIGQELTEDLTPDGRFVDTWRITYQTPAGVTAYIRVPANQYNPDTIDQLIQANVRNVEAVHALGAPAAGSQ